MSTCGTAPAPGSLTPQPPIQLRCLASPPVGGFAARGRSPGYRWRAVDGLDRPLGSGAMGSTQVGYVEALRRKIGHDPVLLTCAGCAVFDGAGRLLLQQRGDAGGPWGLPGGAMELGETVHAAAVRETFEETGLRVRPDTLLGVYTGDAHTYANGDVVHHAARSDGPVPPHTGRVPHEPSTDAVCPGRASGREPRVPLRPGATGGPRSPCHLRGGNGLRRHRLRSPDGWVDRTSRTTGPGAAGPGGLRPRVVRPAAGRRGPSEGRRWDVARESRSL